MVSKNKNTEKRKGKERIAAYGIIFKNDHTEKSPGPGSKVSFFDHKATDVKGRNTGGTPKYGLKQVRRYIPDPLMKINAVFRKRFRGSMVVEAAMVIPVFVFAVTILISIIMVTGVQMRVRQAVHESVRSAGSAPYSLGISPGKGAAAFTKAAALGAVKVCFMDNMREHTTASGLIEGGAGGVVLTTDMLNREAAAIHITAAYKAKVPLAFWSGGSIDVKQEIESYAWLGDEFMDGSNREKMVYITPHGSVYHEDINCTYLKPAVYSESYSNVGSLRNSGGERYRGCESCTKKTGITPGNVYITKYGNRYHINPNCVKIRHEVITVPVSKVRDRHLCLKEQGKGITGR